MLQVSHLRKSYGALVAVDDVSFRVEPGKLLGLLGPNGAGKTTTVSMIAGPRRRRTAATSLIDGAPLSGDTDPDEAAHRPGAAGPRALRRARPRATTCASSARSTACAARRSTQAIAARSNWSASPIARATR